MRVEYINPFIEAVDGLFTTMLGCSVHRVSPGAPGRFLPREDVTAVIGLSGPARGVVALKFPIQTACAMVGRMLHLEGHQVQENVCDGVAEIVNIVAGSAKAKLNGGDDGPLINLSMPTVVRGQNYSLDHPSGATWLDVPFRSDLGAFTLRVTFDVVATQATTP